MISNEMSFLECLSPTQPFYVDYFGCFYVSNGDNISEVALALEFVETNLVAELNNRLNKFIKVGFDFLGIQAPFGRRRKRH